MEGAAFARLLNREHLVKPRDCLANQGAAGCQKVCISGERTSAALHVAIWPSGKPLAFPVGTPGFVPRLWKFYFFFARSLKVITPACGFVTRATGFFSHLAAISLPPHNSGELQFLKGEMVTQSRGRFIIDTTMEKGPKHTHPTRETVTAIRHYHKNNTCVPGSAEPWTGPSVAQAGLKRTMPARGHVTWPDGQAVEWPPMVRGSGGSRPGGAFLTFI